MNDHFTLAHLSDVHLGPLPRFPAKYWNAKRVLGYLNWHRARKARHQRSTLDRLVADLLAQNPDHIAVTGDLVNIGLPAEYEAAARWLTELGSADRVTVVPGNHDIYTHLADDPGHERWRPSMQSNEGGRDAAGSGGFPFVRRYGPIALIGLNSAVPTRPFHAGGRLGTEQRERVEAILGQLGADGVLRVVLIHHPPLPGQATPQKALQDAAELEGLLKATGAELVLHGHNHRSMHETRRHASGDVHVIGVPSASLGQPHKGEHLARYHLFRLPKDGSGIEMVARGLLEPGGPVVEIERRRLSPSPPDKRPATSSPHENSARLT